MISLKTHCVKWAKGCGSSMCSLADYVILGKGDIPCDILFIGIAPGDSENANGEPFVGPAGHELDRIVKYALDGYNLRLAYTNLVCCMPRDHEGMKVHDPEREQVISCSERLIEFISIASPRLIITLGDMPKKWLNPQSKDHIEITNKIPKVSMEHPAVILYETDSVNKPLVIKRQILTLRGAARQTFGEPKIA